jgi:hypothetical protein
LAVVKDHEWREIQRLYEEGMAAAHGIPGPTMSSVREVEPNWKPEGRDKTEKRTLRGERRSALRSDVEDRAEGMCEWSECNQAGAHMAHIKGIGRGGDTLGIRDTLDNVMLLCVYHHDLLDGRTVYDRLDQIEVLLVELNRRRHG